MNRQELELAILDELAMVLDFVLSLKIQSLENNRLDSLEAKIEPYNPNNF